MTVLLCAAASALNIAFYVAAGHHWWNLAAAVFTGILAIANAVVDR